MGLVWALVSALPPRSRMTMSIFGNLSSGLTFFLVNNVVGPIQA